VISTLNEVIVNAHTQADTEAEPETDADALAEAVADNVAEGAAVTATGLGVGVGLITTHWLLMHSSSARQQRTLFTRLSEGIR
jgi:hypothetical protein